MNKKIEFLNEKIDSMWHSFQSELNTDENKDYRRGFRAGTLFAALQIRNDLIETENDSNILEIKSPKYLATCCATHAGTYEHCKD